MRIVRRMSYPCFVLLGSQILVWVCLVRSWSMTADTGISLLSAPHGFLLDTCATVDDNSWCERQIFYKLRCVLWMKEKSWAFSLQPAGITPISNSWSKCDFPEESIQCHPVVRKEGCWNLSRVWAQLSPHVTHRAGQCQPAETHQW